MLLTTLKAAPAIMYQETVGSKNCQDHLARCKRLSEAMFCSMSLAAMKIVRFQHVQR